MSKFKLGIEAKDKITGFRGFITGHAEYLTGCDQYIVQPPVMPGEYIEGHWFDEGRLEMIREAFTPDDVKADKNGCDYSAPIK